MWEKLGTSGVTVGVKVGLGKGVALGIKVAVGEGGAEVAVVVGCVVFVVKMVAVGLSIT
jgi:hypothetical protein